MASLLLGAPPMATAMAMVPKSFTLSPSLSFSRSRSVVAVALTASTAPLSSSASSSAPPLIYCGRGDKKTARGKRFKHSFGNARPRNKKKGRGPPRVPTPPAPPRKDPFEDDELIEIEIDENLFSG